MKIVLTGHLGTVGKPLKEKLSANYEVIGFDIKENASQDITSETPIQQFIIDHKPDIVIHCAAIPSPRGSMDKKIFNDFWNINVLGTKNVAFACLNSSVKKLVYISSGCVYGWDGHFNNDETDVKIEPYCTSKRIAEEIVRYIAGQGICTSILRLAPVGNRTPSLKFFNTGASIETIYKHVIHAINNQKWLSIYNVTDNIVGEQKPICPIGELSKDVVRCPSYNKMGA